MTTTILTLSSTSFTKSQFSPPLPNRTLFFKILFIYLFERERESKRQVRVGRGAKGEGERISSRLHTVPTVPSHDTKLMTWAKIKSDAQQTEPARHSPNGTSWVRFLHLQSLPAPPLHSIHYNLAQLSVLYWGCSLKITYELLKPMDIWQPLSVPSHIIDILTHSLPFVSLIPNSHLWFSS